MAGISMLLDKQPDKNGAASKYELCISRLSFIDKHDNVLIHVLIFYCTFMQNWAKEMLLSEKNK